jgi:hypothetical protein
MMWRTRSDGRKTKALGQATSCRCSQAEIAKVRDPDAGADILEAARRHGLSPPMALCQEGSPPRADHGDRTAGSGRPTIRPPSLSRSCRRACFQAYVQRYAQIRCS